MEYLRKI